MRRRIWTTKAESRMTTQAVCRVVPAAKVCRKPILNEVCGDTESRFIR
jgi:hypothetical protein